MSIHLALGSLAGLSPVAHAQSADCELSESDYYALREEIRDVRRAEGVSIGIAAEGPQCQQALDAVVRNGPFLGVRRVEDDQPGDRYQEQCVAVVRPGPGGYQVDRLGSCHIDAGGPKRMITAGYWMPLGGSIRLNEDLGRGVSGVADLGWQAPDLGVNPFDLGSNLQPLGDSSKIRGLLGFDLARDGLAGGYIGFRGGIEYTTPAPQIAPVSATSGLVSFVLGHKWIGDGIAAQVGGGVLAVLPLGLGGPRPESLYPAVELRLGATNSPGRR